jgi:integrase
MAIHKLRWSKVQSLTENGMYGDGGNLWLSVTNGGGGKSWVFRWTVPGTRRERVMGLGPVHTVDLEEAREKAREYRKLLMAGKDPLAERDGVKIDQDIASGLDKTVNEVLDEYWDAKIAHKSSHRIKQSAYLLQNHVRDKIGDMPIQKIDTKIIVDTVGLRKLWTEQNPTAVILHSHLKRMFSLAIAQRYYQGKNPAAWVDHLEHVLPPTKDVHNVTHHAYVPYKDIGRFMAKLRSWEDGSSRQQGHTASALLLEFVILTGVRLSEARLATWEEFDLQGRIVWNVPWQHRKTGHISKGNGNENGVRPIPITTPMLEVLEDMQRRPIDHAPKALVFPSPHGGPYEINTCWQLIIKTLKWESDPPITVHGFRSTLTDWCHARGYAPRLVHRQLDHVVGGKVDQAYGHDQMIEERRAMMQLWGDYCARPEPEPITGTVLQMNRRRKGRNAS